MEKRVLLVLSIFMSGLMMGMSLTKASAGPFATAPLARAAVTKTDLIMVGCGWDYPCEPEPDFGKPRHSYRRIYRGPGQIYIRNNYGTVNIEVEGRAPAVPVVPVPAEPVYTWRRPCGPAPAPCEEERPKEDCGVRCWWHRFRAGYCGHGCWAYREQARIEAEEREEKEERLAEKEERRIEEREVYSPPYFYRRAYPPPLAWERYTERAYTPPPRYERPKIDERTPLGRFYGPRYPAQ